MLHRSFQFFIFKKKCFFFFHLFRVTDKEKINLPLATKQKKRPPNQLLKA